MVLRTFIPTPFALQVYPLVQQAANSQGNKSFRNSTTPITRKVQSIHVAETGERITPDNIDRVVTHLRVMSPTPNDWSEGDEFVVPNLGRYRVTGDPAPRNMGPLTQFNYLLGGKIYAKRVS